MRITRMGMRVSMMIIVRMMMPVHGSKIKNISKFFQSLFYKLVAG
ncbi:hypothetical protein [Leptospira selangorensis]|nr:hypothetical protein [Leptospira selangorensis]